MQCASYKTWITNRTTLCVCSVRYTEWYKHVLVAYTVHLYTSFHCVFYLWYEKSAHRAPCMVRELNETKYTPTEQATNNMFICCCVACYVLLSLLLFSSIHIDAYICTRYTLDGISITNRNMILYMPVQIEYFNQWL